MKHTPGPWTFSGNEAEYKGRRTFDWSVDSADGDLRICTGYSNLTEHFPKLEEGEYNARLIAAAPELLEALLVMIHLLEKAIEDEECEDTKNTVFAMIEIAKTKIKKATGGQA